jgi:hypothetical protein
MTLENAGSMPSEKHKRRLLLDNGYMKHAPECYAVSENTRLLLGNGL